MTSYTDRPRDTAEQAFDGIKAWTPTAEEKRVYWVYAILMDALEAMDEGAPGWEVLSDMVRQAYWDYKAFWTVQS